ncbi:DUF342 domain-containing protein [Psychromonas sp. Urea-02u-13]|uniref:DUF342 domain-containing protein n=1 Tax=Psychromonas sp. Urea-02u-13 TaxID=2058326 RepID=UPI000C3289CE|nr:FapA family protein [Psychromonas sp. Urea-02u-13]PKG41002.1 hypothetical protein CXF74_00465 [Psychromonas sp. Urea-02u-13]
MENKQPLTSNLLRLSADKKQLLLLITPVQDEVSVPSLTRLFQSSDHANLKLSLKGLNEAVQSFTRLETQKERSAELESVAIADRLHAQLNISFDPLKMVAKAVVTSAYGGLPLTMEQLKGEMDELEITEGIIVKTLTLLVEKSKQAKAGSSFQASIAKGTQPVQGTDATFKRLVETPKERLLKPKKNEDGTVDMRNLGQLITVKPETQLMRKIPCIEGTDGITVTGEIIPHESGKDFSLELGENTHLCETDENLLLASLSGIPKVLNNGMKVDDVLIISNVDVGYGNVEYEGSVIIEGDICDGMAVKATGDITVSGFVESAHLECGGDLTVGKGIIGHQVEEGSHHYSCEIKSEGSVTASFSQYTKIEAGLEVNIKQQLLHCNVACKGDINVIDEAGMKGTILGGFLCTNGGVNTVSMGASAGSKTHIDLIGNYPILMENKKQINHIIQAESDKLQSLIDAQRKIDILPNSEKKQTLDARLMLTKEEVKKHLSELNTNLNDNKSDLQSYFENAKVVTQKEMFNDVSISIGRDKFRSIRKYGPTKVCIKDFKMLAEPFKK